MKLQKIQMDKEILRKNQVGDSISNYAKKLQ